MGPHVSVQLLLDNSAFVRLAAPALDEQRVLEIADATEQRRVGTCLPFLLEAGYSARSATDHDELLRGLTALPILHIDNEVEQRALDAQRQLARAGHHRLRELGDDSRTEATTGKTRITEISVLVVAAKQSAN